MTEWWIAEAFAVGFVDGGLEEWLETLPGLQPIKPPVLLGVRPLERAEALARVLRCECTFWEAQRAYVDSHRLYLRQWIALELQSLYRMRVARREAGRLRHAGWQERIKKALGYWRNQTVTRCFIAWRMLVDKTHKAWASAEQAVVKMYNQQASRAFNTWKEKNVAYRENKRRIYEATRMMSEPSDWKTIKLMPQAASVEWLQTVTANQVMAEMVAANQKAKLPAVDEGDAAEADTPPPLQDEPPPLS